MKFIDICAGIGGFRLGLEQAGHECVGFVEFNKFAVASYRAMYSTEGEFYHDDITTIRPEEMPRADAWCFGFPCQDISVAGKQAGLNGSRSGIYFDIINLVKSKKEEDKPGWLLIENVKNLLSIDDGWGFARVLIELDEAGYDIQWQLLNSKNFGVPQNRERVFIVANLRGKCEGKVFPIGGANGEIIKKCKPDETITYADCGLGHKWTERSVNTPPLRSQGGGSTPGIVVVQKTHGATTTVKHNETGTLQAAGLDKIPCVVVNGKLKQTDNIANCINANYHKGFDNHEQRTGVAIPVIDVGRINKTQNGQRFKKDGEPMFTLTSQDRHGVMVESNETDWEEMEAEEARETDASIEESERKIRATGVDEFGMAILPPKRTEYGNLPLVLNENIKIGDEYIATKKERDTIEILQMLRKEIGEKAFEEWGLAIVASLQQDGLLQQGMYEKGLSREKDDEESELVHSAQMGKGISRKGSLLDMWENWKVGHSPQGRRLSEQFIGKLDSFIQELSHENSQGKESLHYLWKAAEGIGALRKTLSEIQEIREPVAVEKQNFRIRKLTPKETFRLQGFPDEYFERAASVNSNSQLYKQAGNAVTVNVTYEIGKKLMEIEKANG